MTYELIPQPDAGCAELRIDGATVARIDWMLLNSLSRMRGAPLWLAAVEVPDRWRGLEAVSRPGKDV